MGRAGGQWVRGWSEGLRQREWGAHTEHHIHSKHEQSYTLLRRVPRTQYTSTDTHGPEMRAVVVQLVVQLVART